MDENESGHFADDWEKLRDMFYMDKKTFLSSYSYLTEKDYDDTVEEVAKRIGR